LRMAERRREYHIQQNGRWATQLVSPCVICRLMWRILIYRNDLCFV
jgi:hypothetical protein